MPPVTSAPAKANLPSARPARSARYAPRSGSGSGSRYAPRAGAGSAAPAGGANKPEAQILYQKYFKSVGPRTYAAQLKRAGNGNHFLVLTEGKRDDNSTDVRKTRLFVYSEDFVEFFRMLHETAQFIKANPLPAEIKLRREKFWAKKQNNEPSRGTPGK